MPPKYSLRTGGPIDAVLNRSKAIVKRFLPSLKSSGTNAKEKRFGDIFCQFQEFTMIPKEVYCDNLMLADRLHAVPGTVVECGVWKGGMAAGLCSILGPNRDYFLFDSFQ